MRTASTVRYAAYLVLGAALIISGFSFWYFSALADDDADYQISSFTPHKLPFGAVEQLAALVFFGLLLFSLRIYVEVLVYSGLRIHARGFSTLHLRGPPAA